MPHKLKVLIVDDFNNFRLTLTKIMHEMGFKHVDSVGSGEEAFSFCQKGHYDLILCDYNLGKGKNGLQLLEELRIGGLIKPQDIFILLSAETSRNVVMSAYDCEPSAYLTKPITSKVIQQRLSRLMSKRKEMLDIYKALGAGKKSDAIDLLGAKVNGKTRYGMECQKLLSNLYIKMNQLDKAEELCAEVLAVREVNWARVDLASIKIRKKEVPEAVKILEKVIKENPSYMNAYDILSEALKALNDNDNLQKNLEKAVDVSPMSIARQVSLADVAMDNGDSEVAANAYRKIIKVGANSFHNTTENQLNYAKSVAQLYDKDASKAEEMAKDAIRLIGTLQDNPDFDADTKIKTRLFASQLFGLKGDLKKSEEMFESAKKIIENGGDVDLDIQIEIVNALRAGGGVDEARKKIKELLKTYGNDQAALEKIDPLLDDPVSNKAKQTLAQSNNKGIEAYQKKDYDTAIHMFKKVEQLYPRYVGVKLNLLQTMIGKMRENGKNNEDEAYCGAIVKIVEKNIRPGDAQYDRYRQLQDMLRTL